MENFLFFVLEYYLIQMLALSAEAFGCHKWQREAPCWHVVEFWLICDHLNHLDNIFAIEAEKVGTKNVRNRLVITYNFSSSELHCLSSGRKSGSAITSYSVGIRLPSTILGYSVKYYPLSLSTSMLFCVNSSWSWPGLRGSRMKSSSSSSTCTPICSNFVSVPDPLY